MNMSVTPDDKALPNPPPPDPVPPRASPLPPGLVPLFGATPALFGGNEANLDLVRGPSEPAENECRGS